MAPSQQQAAGNHTVAALPQPSAGRSPGRESVKGEPLDTATRAAMESRLGQDFSRVRVHRGPSAAESAHRLDAWAFTVGDDVTLGDCVPSVKTVGGRFVLAHELAHVVQQRRGGNRPAADPDGAAEREADAVGVTVAAGGTAATVSQGTAIGVARQPNDPNNLRAYAGEQTMGFSYPMKEGWVFFDGPSGSAGHMPWEPGPDGVAYNTRSGELHLVDNKSWKKIRNVGSATAIDPAKSLRTNVDNLIAELDAAKDVPGRIRMLALLKRTKAALAAGQKLPDGVHLVVTSFGGRTTDVTGTLKGRGIEHRPPSPPKPGPTSPPPTSAPPTSPGTTAPATAPTHTADVPAHQAGPVGGGELHGTPSTGAVHEPAVPHVPSTPHVPGPHVPGPHVPTAPHIPHGRAPKIHGGLLIGLVIAGVTYLITDDAYAAAQTLNPAASTTDALRSGAGALEVTGAVARDLISLTPPGAIAFLIWDLGQPRGEFPYDQELYDRAMREGRDPFCAQCHGPRGALDPNNRWNQRARWNLQNRFGVTRQVRWSQLRATDQEMLRQFLGFQQPAGSH